MRRNTTIDRKRYERMVALLEANFFLNDSTTDPVKALEDLLFEHDEMGRDHARMECLDQLAREGQVTLQSIQVGREVWQQSTRLTFLGNKVGSVARDVQGRYVDDVLDKAHRKFHKKRR